MPLYPDHFFPGRTNEVHALGAYRCRYVDTTRSRSDHVGVELGVAIALSVCHFLLRGRSPHPSQRDRQITHAMPCLFKEVQGGGVKHVAHEAPSFRFYTMKLLIAVYGRSNSRNTAMIAILLGVVIAVSFLMLWSSSYSALPFPM